MWKTNVLFDVQPYIVLRKQNQHHPLPLHGWWGMARCEAGRLRRGGQASGAWRSPVLCSTRRNLHSGEKAYFFSMKLWPLIIPLFLLSPPLRHTLLKKRLKLSTWLISTHYYIFQYVMILKSVLSEVEYIITWFLLAPFPHQTNKGVDFMSWKEKEIGILISALITSV